MSAQEPTLLAACSLFHNLDEGGAALGDLSSSCDHERAPAGTIVIAEGTEGDAMYIVQSGRVRVEKRTVHDDAYTVTVLEGRDGAFFGELALLDREKRSASVIAESDCAFVVIRRERFEAWGDRHPAAGLLATRRLAQYLSARLRQANADVVTLFSALVQEIEQRF